MKNKALLGIAILIILVGAIMVSTFGFNVDLKYQDMKQIQIAINNEFKMEEIREITNTVFENKKVQIRNVEAFGKVVAITVKEATDEQIELLIQKTNEIYGIENTKDTIVIENIPRLRIREMIKPYIVPVIITTVVVLAYVIMRYKKWKLLLQVLTELSVIEALYIAVIAITRIAINEIIVMLGLVILVTSAIVEIYNLEKRNIVKKEEKNKK